MYTVLTSEVFDAWFHKLKDQQVKRRIQVRIDRAEMGNLGDHKAVRDGVSEMRVDIGPGYRIYFVQRGHELIILLAGGDKASQTKDIKVAIKLAAELDKE